MPKLTRSKRSKRSISKSKRSISKSKRSKTRRKIRQQRGGQKEWETPFSKYPDAKHHYDWWAGVEERNNYVPMKKRTWDRIRLLGYFAPIRAREWFEAEVAKGRLGATESETTKAAAAEAAEEARVSAEAEAEGVKAAAKDKHIEDIKNELIKAGYEPVSRAIFDADEKDVGL